MLRAVDNKAVDLSDEEYEFYKAIVKEFGINIFQNLINTDERGFITLVKPPVNSEIPLGVVFFCFNVMLNQRLRDYEITIQTFKEKHKIV